MFIYVLHYYLNMGEVLPRVRKTTVKDRKAIVSLYETGEWTYKELSIKFSISIPRVCQIVKEQRQ